jgi:chorismate mutase
MAEADISLSEIRSILERAEDSIIFALLERSQYQTNSETRSAFNTLLQLTEIAQAKAGRYICPEETPFTDSNRYEKYSSPSSKNYRLNHYLSPHHLSITYNKRLLKYYFDQLLSQITEPGSDENPGSSAVSDIALLQAVSRRIHLGKVVAESKLRRDPNFGTQRGVSDQDILAQITDATRENIVLDRVVRKAEQYLTVFQTSHHPSRLTPPGIANFFKDFIIPITKQVQVDYLRPSIGVIQTN